ncbi:MAG TPA: hypothetical protein VGR24_02935 [bacterium]|jgi:hypothetical protein|nr:hypothetical protein [bacterium]
MQSESLPRQFTPVMERILYEIAQEGGEDEVGPGPQTQDLWAVLLRDGQDLAVQAREYLSTAEEIDESDLDEEDWRILEAAAGVIVTKDAAGEVRVQAHDSEADLAAAWTAVMSELSPEEPGAPTVVSPEESDDNPT